MKIFNWAYDIFKSFDFSDAISSYLNLAINIVVLIVVAYILDYLFKKLFIIFLLVVSAKTKSSFSQKQLQYLLTTRWPLQYGMLKIETHPSQVH